MGLTTAGVLNGVKARSSSSLTDVTGGDDSHAFQEEPAGRPAQMKDFS